MEIVTERRCKYCEEVKPTSEFYVHVGKISHKCKDCEKNKMLAYHSQNREKNLSDMENYRRTARNAAIEHYGSKCACCGESRPEFLAIDHINGGGNKHHKEIKGMAIGIWLKNNGYPEGFRVLCHNCNQSLGHFGYCPHNNLP